MATGFSSFRQVCIDASATDETGGSPHNCEGYPYLKLYLTGVGTINSGVVTVEEADYDADKNVPYGGTWSAIATINGSDVTADVQKAYDLPVEAYGFVRVRISTAIGGGGTVTAVLRGTTS